MTPKYVPKYFSPLVHVFSQGSPEKQKQNQWDIHGERERDFKELAHTVVEAASPCSAGLTSRLELREEFTLQLKAEDSLQAEFSLPRETAVFFS